MNEYEGAGKILHSTPDLVPYIFSFHVENPDKHRWTCGIIGLRSVWSGKLQLTGSAWIVGNGCLCLQRWIYLVQWKGPARAPFFEDIVTTHPLQHWWPWSWCELLVLSNKMPCRSASDCLENGMLFSHQVVHGIESLMLIHSQCKNCRLPWIYWVHSSSVCAVYGPKWQTKSYLWFVECVTGMHAGNVAMSNQHLNHMLLFWL